MSILAVGSLNNSGIGIAFQRHAAALQACEDTKVVAFGYDQEFAQIGYAHGGPQAVSRVQRKPRQIGYLVCESTKLPRNYKTAFNNVDEVWTCSSFCRDVLVAHTDKPVKIVPHYVSHFESQINQEAAPTFLVAFNGHSRILRKLPSLAIAAIKAVQPKAKVVIKTLNLQPMMLSWLGNVAAGLDFEIVNEDLSDEDLLALYRRTDILVSLHAAEGFGLHLLEAMAMGKRVVATSFGGNVDFMNDKNSFLVDYVKTPTSDDCFLGEWALPCFDSALHQISKAVESYYDDAFTRRIADSVRGFDFNNTVKATKAAL